MKAFHTVAIPHKDILAGRLTMDVFAADLWETHQKRGPDEYKDSDTFFQKTFVTEGLGNLLGVVERRLQGRGGDPVIQIQTPFGGGKTHALIAMYHKTDGWKANRVVIVGTALRAEDTLWGMLEKQLTGKITKFAGMTAPGREALRPLLEKHEPLLILMDEVLEYVTKAAGVKVEESTLAAQTMAFMQELTEAAGTLDKVCLAVTLPASLIEHYDERAERLFHQLQKVAGRVEKIYTPVQENEITKIIRRRLFSSINDVEVKNTVSRFMSYAETEGILPPGTETSDYRNRFLDAYPFMPEVVDVLYHRWGSFPTFQRTRGVLRLLSLVIHSQKESSKPYISLADFDLRNQELRQELLKHIGPEYNGVIASDITDAEAGAKKVDVSLGGAYQGLKLGSRAATSIFLYSFSGGIKQGITLGEVKRCATTTGNPSSVVAESVEQLNDQLFFMQKWGDRYLFSNQPNLNRIRLVKMEGIDEPKLVGDERDLLKEGIHGGRMKVFLWEENSGNITDSEDLKLIILRKEDQKKMTEILVNKGQTPRVYRNTLFFLYPLESERPAFVNFLKRKIANEQIDADKHLSLSEEQKKEIKKDIKNAERDLKEYLRRLYRMIAVPHKDGFKTIDLGIPTYGEDGNLVDEVHEKLRSGSEILVKIAPLVLKEKYLVGRDTVLTEQLYQSALKTPGEARPVSRSVLEQGIAEGVQMGLFGLGDLKDGQPVCRNFREPTSVALTGNEVIISEDFCRQQKEAEKSPPGGPPVPFPKPGGGGDGPPTGIKDKGGEELPRQEMLHEVRLNFQVPKGKVSNIMGVMNLLQSKFEILEVGLTARDGTISEQDYQEKIEETFTQLNIKVHKD